MFCLPCGGLRKSWNTDESLRELTFRVGFLFRYVDRLRNRHGVINHSWNSLSKHESSSKIFIRLQFAWENRPRITKTIDFLLISLCFAFPVGGCEKHEIPMVSLGDVHSALDSSSDAWIFFGIIMESSIIHGILSRNMNPLRKSSYDCSFLEKIVRASRKSMISLRFPYVLPALWGAAKSMKYKRFP